MLRVGVFVDCRATRWRASRTPSASTCCSCTATSRPRRSPACRAARSRRCASARASPQDEATRYVGRASGLLVDTRMPGETQLPGGTGLPFDWTLAKGLAERVPVPGARRRPGAGERGRGGERRAVRTPSTCRAASRRCPGARTRRSCARSSRPRARPRPGARERRAVRHAGVWPDAGGHFGPYGGRYVPETLMAPLRELEAVYEAARQRPRVRGRVPTAAARLRRAADAARLRRAALGATSAARVFLKREDLLPHRRAQDQQRARPGAARAAHGQAARRRRDRRRASTASRPRRSCALLGLECVVYMGTEDMARQAPNVRRMRLLGAEVRGVDCGQPHAQGRDQRGDARLGDERAHDPLPARLGARPAPVPDDGARLPAR